MDIRIDTPAGSHPTAESLNDEQYIYAPFTDAGAAAASGESAPRGDVADIAAGETMEREYVEKTYPADVVDEKAQNERHAEDSDNVIDVSADEEEVVSDEAIEMVSKEEYDILQDRYNRLMADWDNYRRRTADEVASAKANANKNMAETLIPTLDNFGFALSHAQSMGNDPAVAEMTRGFAAIYRSLVDGLSREGLEVVDPQSGCPFDMTCHQAVEQVLGSEFPPDTVVKVLQVGYKFNDYVIRPALVAVSV